jgi:hypothetical protein
MSSPKIGRYDCRECRTTDISKFSTKSYNLCRACKRIIKGKKYVCKICLTQDPEKFTQGRYTSCRQCRYKPDLAVVKENVHKAVLEGRVVVRDGVIHPVPSLFGVHANYFNDKNIRDEDDGSTASDSGTPHIETTTSKQSLAPPPPREKMTLTVESEKLATNSLLSLKNPEPSPPAALDASNIKLINNEIEKYLCYNENIFGVSFKAILENITAYNLQKDKLDAEKDEEIQFLREEIARLKYVLNEKS